MHDSSARRFPTIPGDDLRSEFQEHCRRTGTPETFPGISRTPPEMGWKFEIVAEFHIKREQRPDGSMIPCAVCSPEDAKFLDGVLTWDCQEFVLRIIGRTCGNAHDKSQREDALVRYRKDQRQRQIKADLAVNLPHIGAYLERAVSVESAATYASELSAKFRGARSFFHRVSDEIRTHQGATWEEAFTDARGKPSSVRHRVAISGAGFLEPKYNPRLHAQKALAALREIGLKDPASVKGWERDNVVQPVERERVHGLLVKAKSELEIAEEQIGLARAFLASTNVRALQGWIRRRPDLQIACSIGVTDLVFLGPPMDGVKMEARLRVTEARLILPMRAAAIRAA